MKPKVKSPSTEKQDRFKQLKSIKKKPKPKDGASKILKNLKSDLNSSPLKDNKFSQFVKTYNGSQLTTVGKQLLKFFMDKNINIPRRKRKFFNLLTACVGDKVPMTDEQKDAVFDTLKAQYVSASKNNLKGNKGSTTDSEGFTHVGKNKKKKDKRKAEAAITTTTTTDDDVVMDAAETSTEKKKKSKKNKKKKQIETNLEIEQSATEITVNDENIVDKKKKKTPKKKNKKTKNLGLMDADVEMDDI